MRRLAIALAGLSLLGAQLAEHASAATPSHVCRQGDPPITASASTSCVFAGRALSRYFNAGAPHRWSGWVWSPVVHKLFRVSVSRTGVRTVMTGPNGIWARWETW